MMIIGCDTVVVLYADSMFKNDHHHYVAIII